MMTSEMAPRRGSAATRWNGRRNHTPKAPRKRPGRAKDTGCGQGAGARGGFLFKTGLVMFLVIMFVYEVDGRGVR